MVRITKAKWRRSVFFKVTLKVTTFILLTGCQKLSLQLTLTLNATYYGSAAQLLKPVVLTFL